MNDRKERLALFLPFLNGGGAERVMVNLAREFAELGHPVDLVLAKAEGPYLTDIPDNVRIVNLESTRVLFSFPGLVRYLRKERPISMLSTLNHANIIALLARRVAGVPIRLIIRQANMITVMELNKKNIKSRLMPNLMRLLYPWADAIIAISHGVAEDLINQIGVPEEKVNVIYNPMVTPELFIRAEEPVYHPWFAAGEPPVIMGIGRLTKQKDFSTLIRAFFLLRCKISARLMILGEGEERARLEVLIKELGLEQDVILPGFVENPYKYQNRAALFVLSSKWEGLGNVIIEALALNKPIVSTDCPSGPAEILEYGLWGRLVPVGNVQEMAKAMSEMLQGNSIDIRPRSNAFLLDNIARIYAEILFNGK